ncbi:MAG: TIM-barrel domain-containing protein [Bacteroidota bacterium]
MRKFLRLLLAPAFLIAVLFSNAQAPFIVATSQKPDSNWVQTTEGKWVFSQFANQIIKATFIPNNSTRNEQVSDAVLSKPTAILPKWFADDRHVTFSWSNKAFVEVSSEGVAITPQTGKTVSLLQTFYNDSSRGFKFLLRPGEKIFGTGERSIPMDRRGYRLALFNNPWYGYGTNADALNFSVPFIMSSHGYAIFFDNPSKGYLDIGKTDEQTLEYGVMSGELSFYVIGGKSFDDILSAYQRLVGTQQLPPRWAMGNFMSRFGYQNEIQTREIFNQMKSDSIPFDAVIFDLFWFGDSIQHTLGNLDWVNKKAWPNPAKMIGDFKKEGVKTILITEPFIIRTTPNYASARSILATNKQGEPYELQDFYFGKGGLIDIFRKDARQWFWAKYKKQMDIGVTGWWGDLGEPEKHPADMYHNLSDLGFKRKFSAGEVHNLYGYYWSKMVYENFARLYPNQRLFHLNRSGYAASPRYGSFPWSGDVSRSWDGLKAQLPLMLGTSLSGIPYIHADAGGFAGGDGDADLYIRWLQFAAFTPIFKPHGTALGAINPTVQNIPSEPAMWPEPTKSIARQAVEQRYQLLPYNYTLCYQQAVNGTPLVKPMFFVNENDTSLFTAEDQYMWGDALLVAPVLEKNITSRKLYLPGGDWYNYYSLEPITGKQWIKDELVMNHIPVFVKAGSFIPTISTIQITTDYNKSNLTVTYFPAKGASQYELYEDDGESKNAIQTKAFELIQFKSGGLTAKGISISIGSNGGRYKGRLTKRDIQLSIPGLPAIPTKITVNGKHLQLVNDSAVDGAKAVWDTRRKRLLLSVAFDARPVSVQVAY